MLGPVVVVAGWVHFDLELEFELQDLEFGSELQELDPDFDLWDPELDFRLWDPEPDLQDLVLHPQIDPEHLD